MGIEKICILGGTGFVGSHLSARLANSGYQLKILTRNRERHKKLIVMPDIRIIQTDNLDAGTLQTQFAGCDAVINLIGILNGSEQAFMRLHAELPQHIIDACSAAGVTRYLHMSALNASAEHGPSQYLRSKGAGEDAAHAGAGRGIQVTSFQPSVIFGPDDSFFNRFAALLKLSPVLPLACPNARFAPVYVGDVVDAFIKSLTDESTYGQRYELCGPRIYTLKELVEYTAQLIGRKRLILALSDKLSRTQAQVFEKLFKFTPLDPPLSMDNYHSLQVDSVCHTDGLAALGITPKSIESVIPNSLGGQNSRARYDRFRSDSRRR
jgi:NADH dehydrogenase